MVWSSVRLVWSLAPLSRIILSVVMKYIFQPRNPESEDSSDDGGTDDLNLSNTKRLTSSLFNRVHFDLIDVYCGTDLQIIEMAASREYI